MTEMCKLMAIKNLILNDKTKEYYANKYFINERTEMNMYIITLTLT